MTIFNLVKNPALRLCLNIHRNRVFGFTLAEVLITLGIIGIVAAMTIPNLMNNIQNAQFKTAAKKAFSVSAAALTQMKQDEGGSLSYYATTTRSFKPVFMTYFKVIKDYGWSDYVQITTTSVAPNIYRTLPQGGNRAGSYYASDGQFITSDGMLFAIENNNFLDSTILITVDVNNSKPPNTYGLDTFVFQIINDTLVPMGSENSLFPSPNACRKSDGTGWAYQGFGCMAFVMQGIDY